MAYKLHYSDYPGTDTGPPDPERWIGPPGPPGPAGPMGPAGGLGEAYNLKDFGSVNDGTTDDAFALNAAIAAIVALPHGGKLILPAGRTIIGSAIIANIPAGVAFTIEGMGPQASELYFSNATDGLKFTLLNSGNAWGAVSLQGLTVTRGPTSPTMANTGINIIGDPAIAKQCGGAMSFRDLVIQGSGGAGLTNQWTNGMILNGISACSVDNVTILGMNSGATDLGDALLTITGPSNPHFATSINIINSVIQGGSVGVLINLYVQGVFIANSTVIGQYDSIRWVGAVGLFAEELALANSTLNAGHRGIYLTYVDGCTITGCDILHFNTGVAGGWAGIEINHGGYNAIIGNLLTGAHVGTETGILLSDCTANCSTSIIGNAAVNILSGHVVWLQGTTAGAVVIGNSLVGGTSAVLQESQPNTDLGNQWNGVQNALSSDQPMVFAALGAPRWFVGNDGSTESGGNTGNKFEIVAASNAGALLGAPIVIDRDSGIVTIQAYPGADTHLNLNALSGKAANIEFTVLTAPRWFVGPSGAESGGNTGADFQFARVSDAGAVLGSSLTLNRATGNLTLGTLPPNAANDAAAASAGVPVGGVYRNGSILMCRVV